MANSYHVMYVVVEKGIAQRLEEAIFQVKLLINSPGYIVKEEQRSFIETLVARKDVVCPLQRSFGSVIINGYHVSC